MKLVVKGSVEFAEPIVTLSLEPEKTEVNGILLMATDNATGARVPVIRIRDCGVRLLCNGDSLRKLGFAISNDHVRQFN